MAGAWGSSWGTSWGDSWGFPAAPGIPISRGRKPVRRVISAKSLVHAISGPEQDYPVYPFSRRQFFERPKHNPFKDL